MDGALDSWSAKISPVCVEDNFRTGGNSGFEDRRKSGMLRGFPAVKHYPIAMGNVECREGRVEGFGGNVRATVANVCIVRKTESAIKIAVVGQIEIEYTFIVLCA